MGSAPKHKASYPPDKVQKPHSVTAHSVPEVQNIGNINSFDNNKKDPARQPLPPMTSESPVHKDGEHQPPVIQIQTNETNNTTPINDSTNTQLVMKALDPEDFNK